MLNNAIGAAEATVAAFKVTRPVLVTRQVNHFVTFRLAVSLLPL